MAFVTGSATSLTDLLTAIRNACTANGYVLNGNILSNGAGTLHVDMQVVTTELRVIGGTSRTGSVLNGSGPAYAKISSATDINVMTFPVTYHIHLMTAPDEVYVMINFNAVFWNFIAFGQSDHPGMATTGGTGNWYGATHQSNARLRGAITIDANGYGGGFVSAGGSGCVTGAGIFNGVSGWTTDNYATNCFIHSGLNPSGGWSVRSSNTADYYAEGMQFQHPMLAYSPNAWNDQIVLIPINVVSRAASSKFQVVAELRHARVMRNDNYNDLDIIEIGSDKWRVYSIFRKNIAVRNAGAGVEHSGTFAHAIRYDGA